MRLTVHGPRGTERLDADHVLATTGCRVDLDGYAFLETPPCTGRSPASRTAVPRG
ncbi:hypothetical protein [Streptomyces sp. S.PB5]|uniref:hypothetical protein n=1 Tax=Streptomyces sp. S.PB5 TaxID=3020844 RepID=UPI0025B084DD|nr:hypothetical protein [Streptomyces sp. S.PB5]MDN3027191.1 hypothetical protein [Streptomyces sp. S.PB5]